MRSRRRLLIASTSRRIVRAWSTPSSLARAMKPRMSLGRQLPPRPGRMLRRPMRASWPRMSASVMTSAPEVSQTSAIALMKEIIVAMNAFADALASSAVAQSVTSVGVPLL